MSTATAIIPVRYASSRFPGKALADRTGKTLIQHVVERVRAARRIERILVATDDPRILEAVEGFGAQAVMTRGDHLNGTTRIAEVAAGLKLGERDVVANVQGDEPEIDPAAIDAMVDALAADPEAPMATVAGPFREDEDPSDPNIVKAVVDQRGRALFFSRSPIPYDRDGRGAVPLRHAGLYAYRSGFLLRYVELLPTPLEQVEQLEQLRALEHGYPIVVVQADIEHHGIDTPQQYEAFVERVRVRDGR